MKSASAGKTFIKMQNQLLNDDDCACFLVEAIAKKSQNIKWSTTVDGRSVSHRRIRRVRIGPAETRALSFLYFAETAAAIMEVIPL